MRGSTDVRSRFPQTRVTVEVPEVKVPTRRWRVIDGGNSRLGARAEGQEMSGPLLATAELLHLF
jgi:hypothetical protein